MCKAADAFRNGQPSALAREVHLIDALKLEKAILAWFNWGARNADNVAALWPEHCNALVAVSMYLIGIESAGTVLPSATSAWKLWQKPPHRTS